MKYANLSAEAVEIFSNNFIYGSWAKSDFDTRLIDIVRAFLGGEPLALPSEAFAPINLDSAYYVLTFEAYEGGDDRENEPEIFESKAYFLPGNLVYVAFENGEVITVIKK